MGVLLQERYRALGTVLGTAPETLPGLDFEEGGNFRGSIVNVNV